MLYQHTQMLASGIPTETFCLNGFENCDHQAPIATSCHSLYDISFQQLAVGMHNHNTHIIRAFLHFPTEILDVDEWTSYEKGYHFKRDRKNRTVEFSWIGDSAFGYIHDYDTWISYLTKGGFETPFGFNVIIEKTAWHGSQFELTITRATAGGTFYSRIPTSLSDLVRVPNFRYIAARSSMCKRRFDSDDKRNYIITDGSKFRKLLDFINARAEKGFCLDVVKAYARTLVSEIRLGNSIVENRWHCTDTEFSDLCDSAYILSAYQRKIDSHIVGVAFEHMSRIQKKTLWDYVCEWVNHAVMKPFPHFHFDDPIAAQNTSNIFHKVAIGYFKDHESRETFMDLGFDNEVFFGYNTETLPDIEPTAEEILSVRDSVPLPTDPIQSSTPEWALHFGIPANTIPGIGPVYLAEEQHDILIQECLNGSNNEEYVKPLRSVLATAAAELVKSKPDRLFLENIYALTGVPGGAKTGSVICNIIPKCLPEGPVLVLCPTRALADKYQTELTAPSMAATIHAGLRQLHKNKWALVIIEEAFTMPIAYVNFIASKFRTLIVGDPQQIQHVDFSGLWKGTTMLEALLPALPRHHITQTKRCPQDVTLLPLIRAAYPGITSSSPVNASISHVHDKYLNPQAVNICFTQLQKNQLETFGGRNAFTVHECQGMTFPSVILHYSGTYAEEQLLRKSPNHLIVGLTRHTNHLYIRDTTDGDLTTFINDKAPLNIITDTSNIDVAALDVTPIIRPITIEQTAPDAVKYAFTKAEVGAVELVLNKYFPEVAPPEQISTTSTRLEVGLDAKGSIRTQNLGDEEQYESKNHKVYRFKTPQRVMITRAHQKHLLLRTNLERLTHSTTNMPAETCEPLAEKLFEQVEEEFEWVIPHNFHHTCFLEAIEKMNAKGKNLDNLRDVKDWNEAYVNLVKSFLKAQQKPMMGKNPHTADKAGQGISAWDKTLNLIMSPWTRLLEQILVNKSKGRVHILSQMSDLQVMAILENHSKDGERFVDNDWTKFDSNQNNLTRQILKLALEKIGCPSFLIEAFMEQLTSRRICCEQSSLVVNDKKDSGAPHTLVDNCLFNLAICLDLIEDFEHLYIKGDDSLARGTNVRFDHKRMSDYITKCGYVFKPNMHTSGSFVSFLINQNGVALDLPRIAAKVTSRAYTNIEDYHNYCDAIAGTLKNIDMQAGANMCVVNALCYDGSSRTSGRFDVLLSFLFRFSNREIPFNELSCHEAIFYKTDCTNSIRHTTIYKKNGFFKRAKNATVQTLIKKFN
ncbi:non-structural polyprotein [Microbat bastrovirus]|nr:non-structural polyprotein [Microbat bastrovirus]